MGRDHDWMSGSVLKRRRGGGGEKKKKGKGKRGKEWERYGTPGGKKRLYIYLYGHWNPKFELVLYFTLLLLQQQLLLL